MANVKFLLPQMLFDKNNNLLFLDLPVFFNYYFFFCINSLLWIEFFNNLIIILFYEIYL